MMQDPDPYVETDLLDGETLSEYRKRVCSQGPAACWWLKHQVAVFVIVTLLFALFVGGALVASPDTTHAAASQHPPVARVRAAVWRHVHMWKADFINVGDWGIRIGVSPCRVVDHHKAVQCRGRLVIESDLPPSVCGYVYEARYDLAGHIHLDVLRGGGCVATFQIGPARAPASETSLARARGLSRRVCTLMSST